jgi:cation diffusion facilitator CzcD-associated flavoprotein CzcO
MYRPNNKSFLTRPDPGCAVDMPCITYSMSFDPALTYRQWFPSQHEILQYLHHIASKYDINSRLRLNAEMLNATWDEETKVWTVKYRESKSYEISELRSKILVSAIGQLVVPSYGGIKGMDRFKGDILHCICWSADIALDGKDVVVIGNGGEKRTLT